jgi:FlgD Ig-like domain
MSLSSRSCRVLVPALVSFVVASPAFALRVASYNLLNYSSGRTNEFRTVLGELQPDVLLADEVLSQAAVNNFVADVLDVVNPGEWSSGEFVDGPDTDAALFYRTAKVDVLGHHVIATALRNINEWTIRPTSHSSPAAGIRLYAVHLKASTGSANEDKRLGEVEAMRARMETFPPGGNYVVAGDCNIYTSTEPAYQYMINPAYGTAGVVQDPIHREGNWHDNASFADIDTQSPRITQFGGGANGGLDDRFDLILVSPADQDGEGIDALPATYNALGQDGQHFNGAINVPPYIVVTQEVAQALHDASDHLPVVLEFQMPAHLQVASELDVGSVIVGGSGGAALAVGNDTPLPADDLDYSFAAPAGFGAPGGTFHLDAGAAPDLHLITLDGSTVGAMGGDLTLTTDDPDHPTFDVTLGGTVLDHAQPSVDGATLLASTALDLGAVAAGDTITGGALAYDFGYGPLRAKLEVYAAQLTGDTRFFLQSFAPALIAATPASFDVAFDAAGASDGTYDATLTLSTRDEQDLSGATDLGDLTFDLTATVGGGVVGVEAAAAAGHAGFVSIAPNPFGPAAGIRFQVVRPGRVDLRIFDVSGRVVRTLASRSCGSGVHEVTWNGRAADGRDLAPGLYFVRLRTPESLQTRKLVRIR